MIEPFKVYIRNCKRCKKPFETDRKYAKLCLHCNKIEGYGKNGN